MNMRHFLMILAVSISLGACFNTPRNTTQANPADNAPEKSSANTDGIAGEQIVLLPDTDSIHFSGSKTQMVFPPKQMACEDSLTSYTCDCLGNKLNIHVPCNYLRTDYFQYTEGQILTIHYPDSGTIHLLCGTQASLSLSENFPKGRHGKKITVKGYQVTYENVPDSKLALFNKAFALLEKDIK